MNRILRIVPLPLLLTLLIFDAYFIAYGFQRHAAYITAGYDLGIWDQKVWTFLQGYHFASTTQREVTVSLGNHVDALTIFMLTPLYGLWPSPRMLILFQVVWVSLGAWPIYWLARRRFDSPGAGLIFSWVYLLFPALQSAILFDFHGVNMALPWLTLALWSIFRGRHRLFIIAALLAMQCQEDIPLLTLMMGGYVLLMQRKWRVGGLIMAVSAAWFFIANFILIRTFSLAETNIHLTRYGMLGDSLGEVIWAIITRPDLVLQQMFSGEKQFYWARLTVPTAFTALLSPTTLLMALPSLMIITLSAYPPTYQLDTYHYSAPVVPFIVVASINGLYNLRSFIAPKLRYASPRFLQNALLAMVLLATLGYQLRLGYTPLGGNFTWYEVTPRHQQITQFLQQIPAQAVVAAQNPLVPRLSQRRWIYILPKISQQGQQAEYILFDMTRHVDLYPYQYVEEYCAQIGMLLATPDYGLVASMDGLLLFERHAPDTTSYQPAPPCEETTP